MYVRNILEQRFADDFLRAGGMKRKKEKRYAKRHAFLLLLGAVLKHSAVQWVALAKIATRAMNAEEG